MAKKTLSSNNAASLTLTALQQQIAQQFLNDFDNWMKSVGIPPSANSRSQYKSNLNTLASKIDNAYNNGSTPSTAIQDLVKGLPFNVYEYLYLLGLFVQGGDMLYTLTVYDKMYALLVEFKKHYQLKCFNDAHSAFGTLERYLFSLQYKANKISIKERNRFKKTDLHKLDGMVSLLQILGLKNFIKAAVENALFFDPTIVKKQQISLDKARHTTDPQINITNASKKVKTLVPYLINGNTYYVRIDPNNNSFVQTLINQKTNLTIGGQNGIVQNSIISHVWGNAFDPRFFMSLWNIVIIPAWANSLMDKTSTPGSLPSMIQATFMAICHELYNNENNGNTVKLSTTYWGNIKLSGLPAVVNQGDIIHGDYIISVLDTKVVPNAVNIYKMSVSI